MLLFPIKEPATAYSLALLLLWLGPGIIPQIESGGLDSMNGQQHGSKVFKQNPRMRWDEITKWLDFE